MLVEGPTTNPIRKRVRDGPAQDGAHERLVVVNDCHKLVLYRLCAEALGDLARRVDAGLSGEIDGACGPLTSTTWL